MLFVFEVILVSKTFSAFVALIISAVILAVFVFTEVGKVAIVSELTPPTLFTVVAILPFPDPAISPVKLVTAFAAITSVPIVKPKFILAPAAVVAPVPPFVTSIVVPLHIPLVIVPTLVKLEFTTLFASVVPVNVFEFAAIVISELPSNATPLIFLVAANFVEVEAFPVRFPVTSPVKFPVKFVEVTELKPAKLLDVPPRAILVDPMVNELLANLLFAIAVPLQTPVVIVPTVVKELEPSKGEAPIEL